MLIIVFLAYMAPLLSKGLFPFKPCAISGNIGAANDTRACISQKSIEVHTNFVFVYFQLHDLKLKGENATANIVECTY